MTQREETGPQPNAALRVVAWETTRSCPLNCRHCRASASGKAQPGELDSHEGLRLINALAALPEKPLLILTGGEPMSRADIYDLAKAASSQGIHTVMAPCGPLVDKASAAKLAAAGVKAISISVDGPDAASHDSFRGVDGAFESALNAIRRGAEAGLKVQMNCAVSSLNAERLPELRDLALNAGASALDFFFLVPTGRGAGLKSFALGPEEAEKALGRIFELSLNSAIPIKTTCAPQYARVQRLRAGEGFEKLPRAARARSCMAGRGFLFVSHDGILQPCGFLNLPCGSLREADFAIARLYESSENLKKLRNPEYYSGGCGTCAYAQVCGGCRARAFESSDDFLGPAPDCLYATRGA